MRPFTRWKVIVLVCIRIEAYRHVLSIEINITLQEVWRALAYTWHRRFSDGSTDNTSRGRPMYNNCRIVTSAP